MTEFEEKMLEQTADICYELSRIADCLIAFTEQVREAGFVGAAWKRASAGEEAGAELEVEVVEPDA